jgi:hypothetical protein
VLLNSLPPPDVVDKHSIKTESNLSLLDHDSLMDRVMTHRQASYSHERKLAWTELYLCGSSLFQEHTLLCSAVLFLEQWDTAMWHTFATFSITKETNPHTSTVKNITALSLQGQVHVVTATEWVHRARGPWGENFSVFFKCKWWRRRKNMQRCEVCQLKLKCYVLMVCLGQLWNQGFFFKKADFKMLGRVVGTNLRQLK